MWIDDLNFKNGKKFINLIHVLSYYLKWMFAVYLSKHALRLNLDKSCIYQDQSLC